MIKKLLFNQRTFPVNLIQGPLAGVSSAPFRALTWQYSQPAFSCTEMISCKTLIHQPKHAYERFVKKDPEEGPVCFQLASSDPTELSEAVKIATDLGADLIDLNCGCPVKKIRRKGAGSSLLMDSLKLYHLICAMKKNTSVPISIKIRVENGHDDKFNHAVAEAVEEGGADFLIVHGRHWKEHYETPCNLNEIRFFVERLSIPVIGNGDIQCISSLKKMFETGCAGVMISRAGVGQPWLIGQLMAELQQKPFQIPPFSIIQSIFIEHVERLSCLLQSEKFAILHARKLGHYYARHLPKRDAFVKALNTCHTLADLITLSSHFFIDNQITIIH